MILFNDKPVVFEKFPNGETRLKGDQFNGNVLSISYIVLKYESDQDLFNLMILKKFLDDVAPQAELILIVTYMPYSRQDRYEEFVAPTLFYVANFINSLNFKNVGIVEPHSDVTPAIITNVRIINQQSHVLAAVKETGFDKEKDFLLFPDAGAQKRYAKQYAEYKHLVGFKERDFATGKIKDLKVVGDVAEPGFKVIIVDDLCSKGGTFTLAAQQLKEMGATEVYLAVTHCEHSILNGDILKTGLITRVFTTDSICSLNEPKIHITPLE